MPLRCMDIPPRDLSEPSSLASNCAPRRCVSCSLRCSSAGYFPFGPGLSYSAVALVHLERNPFVLHDSINPHRESHHCSFRLSWRKDSSSKQCFLGQSQDCSGWGEVMLHGLETDDAVAAADDWAEDVNSPCSCQAAHTCCAAP